MIKINLADISTSPGVYLFLDGKERIIYVGKAKSLRNRLASYFNASVKNIKTEKMLAVARDLKTIVTSNEIEAFLLESNLIKTELPKYNILLKDSKGYPYVKLTNEEYPRLIYTRNTDEQNASYFGPFVNAGELKEILEYFKELFPLRSCSTQQFNKHKICLKYQIHRCVGPCEKHVTREDYQHLVEEVKTFFKGDTDNIKQGLQKQMEEAAEKLQYETAAYYRDRLKAISQLFARQRAIQIGETRNLDLFYRHEDKQTVGVTQLFLRGGRLIGAKTHFFPPEEDDLLERFIIQFYSNVRQFPDMIVAEGGDISNTLAEGLSKMAKRKIVVRKRGYADLINLAKQNAQHATEEYLLKAAANKDLFPRLSKIAEKEIKRVECVDISHLGGENTVGVSVVSEEGVFNKKEYRKYKIRSAGNNDVQSIKELMERKVENVLEGSEEEADLYLIDGGVSQLNAAEAIIRKAGLDAACLSISEGRVKSFQSDSPFSVEEVHKPNRKNPIRFKKNDPVFLFLQKMRDEAHRFAITYSRKLALKKSKISPLLEIPGMGEKRAKAVLTSIPELYSREDLTAELIAKEANIPISVAEKVFEFIQKQK